VLRRRQTRAPLAPASMPIARQGRRWLYASVAAIAVVTSVSLPAIPAAADTGNITFGSVSGDGSGDLAVTVTSDDPLGSITVYLWPGAPDTGTPALTSSDFSEQGTFSAGVPQTWALNTPSTDLAALPPGTYTATAIATDADADQTTPTDQPLTGTFKFQIVPSITLSLAQVSSTAPGQDVDITGRLNAVQPLAGGATAWGGQSVTITDSSNTMWTGTSAADGSFSIPVTGTPGDSYTASVAPTPANLGATSPTSATDVAVYATTSISAVAAAAPYGKQSITGTLTYQSSLSQNSAPGGVPITATASGQQTVTTTTGANGSFSMMLPAITGTTTWNLSSQANDQATTPFLAGTTTSISATQTWPATLSKFKATLSKYYVLTVGGCLSSTLSPVPPPDYPTVEIQYERTTAGPWVELGTVSTTQMTGCPGAAFLAQGTAPAASAYYRAYFAGDLTYQAATAGSVKAALIATRFSPFASSATTLPTSTSKVTISGTLQYQAASWHGYAYQPVLLIYSKNDKTWYAYQWLKTNSKGYFSKAFTDSIGTAYWSANYDGNATHLVAGARVIKVTVRRALHKLVVGVPTQQAQPVLALVGTSGTGGKWNSADWPFRIATDPLLILMGKQQ
jgi:hypothetical protein